MTISFSVSEFVDIFYTTVRNLSRTSHFPPLKQRASCLSMEFAVILSDSHKVAGSVKNPDGASNANQMARGGSGCTSCGDGRGRVGGTDRVHRIREWSGRGASERDCNIRYRGRHAHHYADQ